MSARWVSMTAAGGSHGAHDYRPRRVAELIADDLRRQIITNQLRDELPREELLLDRFGVSRPSLREALRILETEGLVQVRRGKVGGATVRRPTAESAAYHLGLVMQSEGAQLSDLAAARLVIEPACTEIAALNEGHEAIAEELETLIAENEGLLDAASQDFTASAQRFHQTIVRRCGNLTLSLLAGSLEAVWNIQEQNWAQEAGAADSYPGRDLREEVIKAHRAIARRIGKGDGASAGRAMRAHLEVSQPFVGVRDAPVEVI